MLEDEELKNVKISGVIKLIQSEAVYRREEAEAERARELQNLGCWLVRNFSVRASN